MNHYQQILFGFFLILPFFCSQSCEPTPTAGVEYHVKVNLFDLLYHLAGNPENEELAQSLSHASAASEWEGNRFVPAFINKFQELAPTQSLGAVFANRDLDN